MPMRRRALLALGLTAFVLAPCAGYAQDPLGRTRWVTGDPPPAVEGIHLGDTAEQVVKVLGEPDASPLPPDLNADIQSLRYRDGALMVLLQKGYGVARVMLMRPQGGSIDGIRVGDRLGPMLNSWGEPTFSTSTTGRYIYGSWMIAVRADLGEQRILRLMLGRALPLQALTGQPGPLPPWATATPDPAPAPASGPAPASAPAPAPATAAQ